MPRQKKRVSELDIEEYEFITNSGCCDACHALDGKHFKVKSMMPGDNAPPLHPNCRCSIAAYEDSDEHEAWLDYLDKGGTTEEWNDHGRAEWLTQGGTTSQAFIKGTDSRLKGILQTGGKSFTGGKWYEPYDEDDKRGASASKAYRKISRRNYVDTIAKTLDFQKKEIQQIKRHIFLNIRRIMDTKHCIRIMTWPLHGIGYIMATSRKEIFSFKA